MHLTWCPPRWQRGGHPKALNGLPQLAMAWGAQHLLRQLQQLAWGDGVQLSYLRLRFTDEHAKGVWAAGGLPPGYLAGSNPHTDNKNVGGAPGGRGGGGPGPAGAPPRCLCRGAVGARGGHPVG